jgi:hypothetical protein
MVILFWSDRFTNIETYVGNMLICNRPHLQFHILDGYVRSRNVSELHSLHPILRMMYTADMVVNARNAQL